MTKKSGQQLEARRGTLTAPLGQGVAPLKGPAAAKWAELERIMPESRGARKLFCSFNPLKPFHSVAALERRYRQRPAITGNHPTMSESGGTVPVAGGPQFRFIEPV